MGFGGWTDPEVTVPSLADLDLEPALMLVPVGPALVAPLEVAAIMPVADGTMIVLKSGEGITLPMSMNEVVAQLTGMDMSHPGPKVIPSHTEPESETAHAPES